MNALRPASSTVRSALAVLTAGCAAATAAHAETVATAPVGAMSFNVTGGTLNAPVTTVLALPIVDSTSVPNGLTSGVISSFTSTTISNADGGWSSALSTSGASPWMLKIASGAAAGTLLTVTANTTTSVTVAGADLTTLGIVAGVDRFEFVPVDTLFSLFGSNILLGGPTWTEADNVYVMSSGTFIGYYYDTTLGYWRRANSGSTLSRNDVIIRPDTGVIIARRGPQTTLTFTGTVPTTTFRAPLANAGTTTIHTGFPTPVTIGALSLNTNIPNWRTSSDWNSADQLFVFSAGSWTGFYHNGAGWRRTNSGSTLDRSNVEIPAGAPIQIFRPSGLSVGTSSLVRAMPYTL